MYDIVYTYVNGDDPTHIQSKQQAMNVFAPEPESFHNCRFQSSCEIVFSLFSVFMFVDHQELHKIYVVISDNSHQTILFTFPDWIREHVAFQQFIEERVEYVTHSQIIPLEFLPTFNSHVIELYLSNIPTLLDEFVYFNDDCFLGAPASEAFFFATADDEKKMDTGLSVKANIFPSSAPMKITASAGQKTSMFQSIMNKTFDLLQSRFVALRNSSVKWNKCHHQAKALLRHSCQSVLKDPVFSKAIVDLSARKFRSRQDFAPVELMIGYMYFTGKGQTLDAKPYTFYIEWTQDKESMQTKFQTLQQKQPAPVLICINDIPHDDQKQNSTSISQSRLKPKAHLKVVAASMGMAPSKPKFPWKVQALSAFAKQYFQPPL